MSLSNNPGFELGYTFGQIAVPIGLIVGGIFYARHLSRTSTEGKKVRWPIFAGAAIAILFVFSQIANSQSASSGGARAPWINVVENEAAQPWPAYNDLDQVGAIDALAGPLKASLLNELNNAGQTVAETDIVSNGRVHNVNGAGVVEISLRAEAIVDVVYVVGQIDGKQVVVGCGQDGGGLDRVASGCASKVQEIFGVDLLGVAA